MSGRKKKNTENKSEKPKKAGSGRKKDSSKKSEVPSANTEFTFDSSSFQSVPWQNWNQNNSFSFKFFQRDTQESTIFDTDPDFIDNISPSSSSSNASGKASFPISLDPKISSIPILNSPNFSTTPSPIQIASSPVSLPTGSNNLTPVHNISSSFSTNTAAVKNLSVTNLLNKSKDLPSHISTNTTPIIQKFPPLSPPPSLTPLTPGRVLPTIPIQPLNNNLNIVNSPSLSPPSSPSNVQTHQGLVGLNVGGLFRGPSSEFISGMEGTSKFAFFSEKSLERIGQQLSQPYEDTNKKLLQWTNVNIPKPENIFVDINVNLENSYRMENNILTLYYNTRNDYLSFKLMVKVTAPSSNICKGKLSLVKKKANSESVVSLENYVNLVRTRKEDSLALTVSNKEDGYFDFDHTLNAKFEVNIWDVTKNHCFYKGKQIKPCSKNKCDCDGSMEEAFLLLSIYRRGDLQTPISIKISNGFCIKSSNKRKSPTEGETSANEKKGSYKKTKLLPNPTSPSSSLITNLSPIRPNCWQWTPLSSQTLPHPLAYHTVTQTDKFLVIFGGRTEVGGLFSKVSTLNSSTSPLSNEVWLLNKNRDDEKWVHCKIEGLKPEPRFSHSAVSIQNSTLVFGGELNNGPTNDLWLLELSDNSESGTWKKIEVEGNKPSPRSGHSAIIVPIKGTLGIIIFGGVYEKKSLDDTWILFYANGKGKWLPIQKKGPISRFYHSACLLTTNKLKKMVVFAGCSRSEVNGESIFNWLNDLWLFDIDNLFWEQVTPHGPLIPQPRDGHFGGIIGDKLYVIGGWVGQIKLNRALQKLENKTSQEILSSGLAMLSQLPEATFGNDLWEFDFQKNTWMPIDMQPKPTASGHSAGVIKDYTISLYGGETFPPGILNTSWRFFKI